LPPALAIYARGDEALGMISSASKMRETNQLLRAILETTWTATSVATAHGHGPRMASSFVGFAFGRSLAIDCPCGRVSLDNQVDRPA